MGTMNCGRKLLIFDMPMRKRVSVVFLLGFMCLSFSFGSGTRENAFVVQAMDIHVNNGNTRTLVQGIARSAGVDVVGGEELTGNLDLHLTGVSPIEALEKIGTSKGLAVVRENNRIYFTSAAGDKSYEGIVLEPRYIRTDKLAEGLRAVVSGERIAVVKETNQVILYGSLRERETAKNLLAKIDRIPQQVTLEVKVIAVQDSFLKEQGINWSWLSLTGHGKDSTGTFGSIRFGRADDGASMKFFYKPELALAEKEGKAHVVAQPNIMAMNGEEARILIGDRVPVLVETKSGNDTRTTIEYEEAGIKLHYTPYVGMDGYIDTMILAEVSTPQLVPEMKAYRITTREASTRVRLKDGETLVIGGLMDMRNESVKRNVPILGNIPVLGKLFRYSHKSKDQVELIISITAHVLKNELLVTSSNENE